MSTIKTQCKTHDINITQLIHVCLLNTRYTVNSQSTSITEQVNISLRGPARGNISRAHTRTQKECIYRQQCITIKWKQYANYIINCTQGENCRLLVCQTSFMLKPRAQYSSQCLILNNKINNKLESLMMFIS